jgi:hypothetical protein
VLREQFKEFRKSGVKGFMTEGTLVQRAGIRYSGSSFEEIQSEWGEGVHGRRYVGSEGRDKVLREQFKEFRKSGVKGFMTEGTLVQRAGIRCLGSS